MKTSWHQDVRPLCRPPWTGSEATLELRGLNLQQQQRTKPYARLRGHDLAATAVEASGSRSRNSGVLGVRVSLPGRAVGLMVVEVGVGHLLGGWWPVLVLPPGQEAAAEELRRVQEQQQRQGDTAGARRWVGAGRSVCPVLSAPAHGAIT